MAIELETLEATLSALDDFARRNLPDTRLRELDRKDEFPEELVRRMCSDELGIQLFFVPEQYGGLGAGSFGVYRICERLAGIDVGIATGVLATFLGSEPISVGGTEAQRQQWLGRIAEQGILMAYGATEPAAGSDLAALRTVAERVEEGGRIVGYEITGTKQWISNGGVADLYTILANAPGGPSWFVVDKGTPGLSAGKPEDKHGIRASNTAALALDKLRVGADRLVGGVEGQGLIQAQAVFGYTRLMVAAFGLGAGWAALDRAIEYSRTRVQAGAPLAEKQGYTHKLIVPHAARLEAARAYIEEVGTRLDAGEGQLNTEGAIAKYLATEAGNAAADASIQALGGYGYTKEYMVEKVKRDVRITTIYEGTSEIMEMTIARDRWQAHLKTRGQHYHEVAAALEALEARRPECGARFAALAAHALAGVLERARVARLTRHQHILLRLGELIAWCEGAAAVARRAVALADGTLDPRAPRRFDATAMAALARVFARDAARKISGEGLAHLVGAGGVGDGGAGELAASLGIPAIQRAQAGQLADLDRVADALYGRAGT
ncbi:MAG TPA: acyl-CoA dehydrogenase family protein [Kofleriaceae bacterium]|nr:acyl-CoA dehydrogenase family protein [Kofleriaceae bacterium]